MLQPKPPGVDETVEHFLDEIAYASLDDVSEVADTPLHWAMMLSHPALVQKILAARPEMVGV